MSLKDAILLLFTGIIAAIVGVALIVFAFDPDSSGVRGITICIVFLCAIGSFFAFFGFFKFIRNRRADSNRIQSAEKADKTASPIILSRLPIACWRFVIALLTSILPPVARLTIGLIFLLIGIVLLCVELGDRDIPDPWLWRHLFLFAGFILIGIILVRNGVRGICKKDRISVGTFTWRIIAGVGIAGCVFSVICLFVGFSELASTKSISQIVISTIILIFSIVGVIMSRSRTDAVNPLPFASRVDYSPNASELPDTKIIRAILLDKAIPTASNWLIGWGVINFGLWIFEYQKATEQLSQATSPQGAFNLFCIYGGGVIGVTMLVFGVIGKLTKSPLVGYTNGTMLIIVGLWNFISDFVIKAKTNTHSSTVWDFWTVVGFIQLSSGFAGLARFWRFGFYPIGVSQEMKDKALLKIQVLIQQPENYEIGPFKIEKSNSNPFSATSDPYKMWLLPDKAIFLRDDLNDYYEVDRQKYKGRPSDSNMMNGMGMTHPAVQAYNKWLQVETPIIPEH